MIGNAIRYLKKEDVIEINNAAIRENRNRQLNEEFVDGLSEDKLYIVLWHMYHTKNEIRIMILFDEKCTVGFVDMSEYRFNMIPIATRYDDGTFEFEDPQIKEEKRPYPKGREWTEKIVRSPVRKQDKFRKAVLTAYENQCAVCNIKEPSLLRAAHITPVVEGNDDTVNNGICLCINHEVAFDRGILRITPDGYIIIKNNADIKTDVKKIRFPDNKDWYPSYDKLKQRFDEYEE